MFTTSVFWRPKVQEEPSTSLAIIWRRQHGICDFFIRCPIEEAESIVETDAFQTGLDRSCYEVKQG